MKTSILDLAEASELLKRISLVKTLTDFDLDSFVEPEFILVLYMLL